MKRTLIFLCLYLAFGTNVFAETGHANLNGAPVSGNIATYVEANFDTALPATVSCHTPLVVIKTQQQKDLDEQNTYGFFFPGCDTLTTGASRFVLVQVTPLVANYNTTTEQVWFTWECQGTQPEIYLHEYAPLATDLTVLEKTSKQANYRNLNWNATITTPALTISTVTALPTAAALRTRTYRGSLYFSEFPEVPLGISNAYILEFKSRASNDPINWAVSEAVRPK